MIIFMKRLLILLSAASCAAMSVADEAPKVKLGGRIDSMVGFVQQSDAFKYATPNDPTSGKIARNAVVNDTKLDINIDGEAGDIKYGGLIRLNVDTSKATSGKTGFGDKTMAYVQHNKIGRLEVGNYFGAGAAIEMDGTNFAVGGYGVDGFANLWVNEKTMLRSVIPQSTYNTFMVSPNLPSNYSGNKYSDAPKITFFTEPLEHLLMGISYIPNLDSTGTVAGRANKNGGPVDKARKDNPPTLRDIFSAGIQYTFDVQQVKIKAGVAGEIGKSKKTATGLKLFRDLKAYEATLAFTYDGYTLFGSYGDWGKSGTFIEAFPNTKQGASYWTLGLAKAWDKLHTSVTYMKSKKAGGMEFFAGSVGTRTDSFHGLAPLTDGGYNKYENAVVDLEYKITSGLAVYAEYSYFKFKEYGAPKSNKGSVVLLGSRIVF